jgi:hypothetical protein
VHGIFEPQTVDIDDSLDRRFKPGLFRQVEAFFGPPTTNRLQGIEAHRDLVHRTIATMWSGN